MNTRKDFISSITLLIVFLFSTYFGYSQGVGIPMDKILYSQKPSITSPNAAALEKYIEFPVANYTGVPDISIPIHQIALKGLTVPIGLSYHASGIKVEEVASDVGIGWSVNTGGGSINILSNGMLDEISNYPLNDPVYFQKIKTLNLVQSYQGGIINCNTAMMYASGAFSPDPYNLYSGTDIGFLSGVVRGTIDAEPDLYMFSFLGRSGKFFLDENAVFRTIPYSEIKIERLLVNAIPAGYKLTDENGIIYEFKTKEESGVIVNNNSVPPWSLEYTRETKSRSYNLSKIITPTGESVEFNYTQYPLSYNLQKIFSKATFGSTAGSTSCYQFNGYGNYFYSSWSSSYKDNGGSRIESIQASDGTLIKFLYSASDRTDLPGSKALERIEIWSYKMGQKMFNEFNLVQDYSTGRLTLKSLQESTKPASQFVYNSTVLPDRLSYAQDTFGFFNNHFLNDSYYTNTLLPKDEYMEFWEGADRSISPAYTQAGMLTKIIHPTGGSTEYIYEPSEIYVSQNTDKYPKEIGAYLVSNANQTVSANFTITNNSKKIRMNYTDTWDGTTIHNDYCIIHLDGPNNYHHDFVGNSNINTPPLNLSPGQYSLSIENVGSTYIAEVTFYWFEKIVVPPHNEIAGGVRIKEINKYDRDGNIALLKKFEYKQSGTNNSSGLINVAPVFTTYQDQNMFSVNNNNCIETYCQYESQNSNASGPLTYANGSYVLYSEVTTYLRDKTQNGYSNYKYNVTNEGFNSFPSFPYAPSIPYDWTNGILLEQTDYSYKNNQFIPIKKIKNYYNYNGFDPGVNTTHLYKTFGAKIAIQNAPQICFLPCINHTSLWTTCSNISFGIQGYKYFSSWLRLDKTDETIYNENGSNPLTSSVNYYYDNPNRIAQTRVETVNSKGELLKTEVKYSYDFPYNSVYDGMVAKNMIAPVIEQSNFKNAGNFLQSTKANYNFWNNGWGVNNANSLIVPQTVETKLLNNLSETRQQINRYDAYGNIQEIQKPNDVKEVYIYGYNSNYPVAKIIGSNYITISSFINQTILDNVDGLYTDAQVKSQLSNIRTGLAGTKALVTTYTYFPFVGMASETDPNGKSIFYEYDNLNRLTLVRDKDNNILKKICYNYHGQPEDCVTSNCTNSSPIWQNTSTALRCQKDWTGQNTGNQEQEQVDINTCSLSHNQTQWVSVGQNTTACPLPVYTNLTSTNIIGASGYTSSYFNTATNHTYTFTVPATTGLQSLGAVPAGNYTLTISRTSGTPMYGTFKSGCFKQIITGTSATFYNVAVSSTTCNSITVDISGIE